MADKQIELYIAAVADAFVGAKTEVQDALRLIKEHISPKADPQGVQLLALRRCLRLGAGRVHAHWAWTPEQVEHFLRMSSGRLLADEAAKVQRNFATSNPGYSLGISPLRSLERQVRLWNGNNTVQRAGHRLLTEMKEELKNVEDFPAVPDGLSVGKFRVLLRSASVVPEPTSAAPGTSDHGQMRAVDFVVLNGRTVIAGTSSAQIYPVWKTGGWEDKLAAATRGTKLVGPLKHPYEPWHWTIAQ
jgi:hypothetical protein